MSSRLYSVTTAAGKRMQRRFFAHRVEPPLYGGSFIDDLLFGHPVNTLLRVIRVGARLRRERNDQITVIIVNFNTLDMLRSVVEAVRRFSPPNTEIVVVDNGSTDGSRAWLKRRRHGCRSVLLPFNLGHGRALDVGIAFARSSIVVTLDSDAFPYSTRWLEVITGPIRREGMSAAGMWGRRDRLHPACSAYRRSEVLGIKTTFALYWRRTPHDREQRWGDNMFDTGELMFQRLGSANVRLYGVQPWTGRGSTMEDCVFHLEGGTTIETDFGGDTEGKFSAFWNQAVAELLGRTAPSDSGGGPVHRSRSIGDAG